MSGTILMAYGSKHGSTQEVAHAVAEELEAHGVDVETLPAREVDDLRPYAGVVVGGSIYMGRWHADAIGLLHRHKYALAELPLAVFGMGPRTLNEKDVHESRAHLDRALTAVDPSAVAIFGGVVDPSELSFPFNKLPASDARDWNRIREWAEHVAELMRNAPHTMRQCTVPS
jgi:menaquinone-dependent protoporphyrinogen oxidase